MDWRDVRENAVLLEFTQKLSRLRREHPVFHRRRYFQGRTFRGSGGLDDIVWLNTNGDVMSQEDWDRGWARTLGVFLNGAAIPDPDSRGNRVTDDSFLLLFNAHYEPVDFTVPSVEYGESWEVAISTSEPLADHMDEPPTKAGASVTVDARAIIVLRRQY